MLSSPSIDGNPKPTLASFGVMMPVLEQNTKYIKPAKYDDLLTIKTTVKEKAGTRIRFEYEVFNEKNNQEADSWLWI